MPPKHIGFDPPSGYAIDYNIAPKYPNFQPAWDLNSGHSFGLQVPTLTKKAEILNDLVGMGESEQSAQEIMNKPERPVDGLGQPPAPDFPPAPEDQYNLERVERDYKPNMMTGIYREANRVNRHQDYAGLPAGYKSLVLDERWPNWVLFDPDSDHWLYPKDHDQNDMPGNWKDWLYYTGHNTHIIAYNEHSQSFKLRRVRRLFQGKRVVYTPQGPRLEHLVAPTDVVEVAKPTVVKKGGKKKGKKTAPNTKKKASIKTPTAVRKDTTGETTKAADTPAMEPTRRISPRTRKVSAKAKEAQANAMAENDAAEKQNSQKLKIDEVQDTDASPSKRPKRGV